MNASPTRAAKAHTLCALDQRAADASAASASADEATRALQVIRDELLVSACECAARFAAVEMDLKAARAEADAAAAAADAAEERLYEHLAETTCECDNQLTMVEALVARNSMLEKAFAAARTRWAADMQKACAGEALAASQASVAAQALEAVRASAKGAAKQAAAELAALRASSKATAASMLIERRVMASTLEVVEATAAAARCSYEKRACDAEAAAAAVAAIAAAALTRACADRDAAVTALQQLRGDAHSLAQLTLAEKKHLLTKLYDSSCAVRRAVLDAEVDARVAEAAACPSCLLATRTTSLNCGHCICAACAAQLESCPICSERVLTRNRIFI